MFQLDSDFLGRKGVAHDLSFPVDENQVGDTADVVARGQLFISSVACDELWPGHFFLFEGFLPVFFFRIERDADHIEPVAPVLVVEGFHLGDGGTAGTAP